MLEYPKPPFPKQRQVMPGKTGAMQPVPDHGERSYMIEKISGRVAYAVMSFGGFLGMGTQEHSVPWNKLTYDTNLGGYRTDITEQQLRAAPAFSRDQEYDWSDRNRERELHSHYGARPYWEP